MFKVQHVFSVLIFILFSTTKAFASPCIAGPSGSSDVCVIITDVSPDGSTVTLNGFGGGYNSGDPIDFSNRLHWYSDIDGFLGTGSEITAVLSMGRHQIRATWGYPGASWQDTKSVFVREKFCATEQASLAYTTDEYYSINFVNKEDVPLKIYWLTYAGERMHFATLLPGESLNQNGYPGNQWLATDQYDQCINVVSTGYYDAGWDIQFEH